MDYRWSSIVKRVLNARELKMRKKFQPDSQNKYRDWLSEFLNVRISWQSQSSRKINSIIISFLPFITACVCARLGIKVMLVIWQHLGKWFDPFIYQRDERMRGRTSEWEKTQQPSFTAAYIRCVCVCVCNNDAQFGYTFACAETLSEPPNQLFH